MIIDWLRATIDSLFKAVMDCSEYLMVRIFAGTLLVVIVCGFLLLGWLGIRVFLAFIRFVKNR